MCDWDTTVSTLGIGNDVFACVHHKKGCLTKGSGFVFLRTRKRCFFWLDGVEVIIVIEWTTEVFVLC